jgi:hypothetical protein
VNEAKATPGLRRITQEKAQSERQENVTKFYVPQIKAPDINHRIRSTLNFQVKYDK